MALTYEQSAALMVDAAFIDRVKVACLKYANYIWSEASSVPGHSSRIRWAQQTMTTPGTTAQMVTPPTVMDDAVQNGGGAAIDDAALQGAVENTVNKLL
jgi:hypothetical protein